MDLKVYNEMISSSGIDPEFVECHSKLPMGKVWFQQDIIRKKAMWTGNIWFDWRLFLCNKHSLLSLCFAVPDNQYTTKWILVTLWCILLTSTFWISLSLVLFNANITDLVRFTYKKMASIPNTLVLFPPFCANSYNIYLGTVWTDWFY